MNTYYIELDFVRAEIKETGIAISQGDYGRVKFSIAVKKDGEIITDAASADISFQLTNGYIVQGVLSGAAGLYDYIFQGNELQAPGKTIATVTLNYTDGRTSSEAFSFDVRYNPLYGRFINAGPYITDLENIKSQAQAYVEYLEKLIEQIKQEMGQTALTKESLANNFDVTEEGVKALDAAAGRTLDLKKVDRTAIVQAESTDPSTVPSSAYFKQVTDRVISDFGDIKTGTYTAISNSYVSIVAGSLRKVGKLCQIYLSLNIQQNGGGYASFITLPSGFLPLELGYFDIPKCTIQVKANQLGINATATGTTALYFTYLSN